jgi:fibronectin-binding autotransporter adhesin
LRAARRAPITRPARARHLRARLAAESLEDRSVPATFIVTNLLDNGSAGSLRSCINQANSTSGADTIVFDEGLTGTINLGSAGNTLLVSDNLTITGPGAANLHISANNNFRHFYVAGGRSLSVSGLTLAAGFANGSYGGYGYGGSIYTEGHLTVSGVTFSGNRADYYGGAIFFNNGAPVAITVNDSTFTGNSAYYWGGAIYSYASGPGSAFAVTGSTFSGNTAQYGGGGAINVRSQNTQISTFFNNSTSYNGGGYTTRDL